MTVLRGGGALSAEVTQRGGEASVSTPGFGPVMAGDLYARAWFNISSRHTLEAATLLIVGEDAAPWSHVAFEVSEDGHAAVWIHNTATQHVSPAVVVPIDTWFCAELHLRIGETDGAVDLWLDGELAVAESGVDTATGAGYDRIAVGVPYSTFDQRRFRVYVDEVAVTTAPLPCDC